MKDELEEIEELIEKLKEAGTRAERRRLLAQFNRQKGQVAIWGQ